MESFKFFINLCGSPKVLYSDLLLCYYIGFDEFFFFFKKNIYITLTMQLTSYKYIFQLQKHTKSLPLPQPFPSLNTYVLYIHFSVPLHTHTHTFYIYIGFLLISLKTNKYSICDGKFFNYHYIFVISFNLFVNYHKNLEIVFGFILLGSFS